MVFVSNSLADGRPLRTFNVLDDHNRKDLSNEADLSLPSARVIGSGYWMVGKPAELRCDNGSEYIQPSYGVGWKVENNAAAYPA